MKFKLATAAAAVVMTASAAQAADLAKKAPAAVDYVKVCDTYGAGFFYIPGSDTCLKIGGYTRAQIGGGDGDFGSFGSDRSQNAIGTYARLLLTFDARSQTEYGLLRAFSEIYWTFSSGGTSPSTTLNQAYVQFGGLTAGRAQSFFDFYTGNALNAYGYSEVAPDAKTNLFAYTFGFGNGVSATVSIEDASTNGRRYGEGTYLGGFYSDSTYTSVPFVDAYDNYGGVKWPDVVANVAISQAWGKAQIMAAVHSTYDLYDTTDDVGFAIGAGVLLNAPFLAAGDYFVLQAQYAKGAVGYTNTWGASGMPFDMADFDSTGLANAWSIGAGFHHVFSSTVAADIQGGYFKYNAASNLGVVNADYDASVWSIGGSVDWTPVKNLTVRLGADYAKINDGATGRAVAIDGEGASYATARSTDGMDAWSVALRIQRSF